MSVEREVKGCLSFPVLCEGWGRRRVTVKILLPTSFSLSNPHFPLICLFPSSLFLAPFFPSSPQRFSFHPISCHPSQSIWWPRREAKRSYDAFSWPSDYWCLPFIVRAKETSILELMRNSCCCSYCWTSASLVTWRRSHSSLHDNLDALEMQGKESRICHWPSERCNG